MTTLEPWPLSEDKKSRVWHPGVLESMRLAEHNPNEFVGVIHLPDVFAEDVPVIGGETMATVDYFARHGLFPCIDVCPRVKFVLPVRAEELGRVRLMWPGVVTNWHLDEEGNLSRREDGPHRMTIRQPYRPNVYLAGMASTQAELDSLANGAMEDDGRRYGKGWTKLPSLLSLSDLAPLSLWLTPAELMDLRGKEWIFHFGDKIDWLILSMPEIYPVEGFVMPLVAQAREASIPVWCEAEGLREVPQ